MTPKDQRLLDIAAELPSLVGTMLAAQTEPATSNNVANVILWGFVRHVGESQIGSLSHEEFAALSHEIRDAGLKAARRIQRRRGVVPTL